MCGSVTTRWDCAGHPKLHLVRDSIFDRPIDYLGNPRNCWGFGCFVARYHRGRRRCRLLSRLHDTVPRAARVCAAPPPTAPRPGQCLFVARLYAGAGRQRASLRPWPTAKRFNLPLGADLRAECMRTALAQQLPGGATPGARSAMRRLDGFMSAHLAELFARAGVPLAYRGGRGSPLDLRPVFRTALRWHLWAPLRCWLQLQQRHPLTDRSRARRRIAAQWAARVFPPRAGTNFRGS
jgi:hypothetical protein